MDTTFKQSATKDVSDTAFRIAACRALETERKHPLFRDPYAGMLVSERGGDSDISTGVSDAVVWSVAIRTRLIDDAIQEAIRDGAGVILNLGAGLDTRPYRMDLPPGLQWFEVDFPHLLEFKEEALKLERPVCRLSRLKMDLTNGPLRRKVFSEINAAGGSVFVLTEGVVPYLSVEAAGELARDLFRCCNFRVWMTDYFSTEFMALYRAGKLQKYLNQAPFQFFPDDWEEHHRSNGWDLHELRYLADEARLLKRPAPLPWKVKALSALRLGRAHQSRDRMIGYAVLHRGIKAIK